MYSRLQHCTQIYSTCIIAVNHIFSAKSHNPTGILGLQNPQSWITGFGKPVWDCNPYLNHAPTLTSFLFCVPLLGTPFEGLPTNFTIHCGHVAPRNFRRNPVRLNTANAANPGPMHRDTQHMASLLQLIQTGHSLEETTSNNFPNHQWTLNHTKQTLSKQKPTSAEWYFSNKTGALLTLCFHPCKPVI